MYFLFPSAEKTSSQALSSAAILKNFSNDADIIVGKQLPKNEVSNWYSIFPMENKELVYGNWEDKIIWDDEVSTVKDYGEYACSTFAVSRCLCC